MGSYSIRFLIVGHFFMDGKVACHHGRAVAHIQEHRFGHAGPGFPLSPLGSSLVIFWSFSVCCYVYKLCFEFGSRRVWVFVVYRCIGVWCSVMLSPKHRL